MTSTAVWLTIRVGKVRVPLPLPLLLPVAILLDVVLAVVLAIMRIRGANGLALPIVLPIVLPLSRVVVALLLHGGRFRIRVRDGSDVVQIGAGWRWG